MKYFSLWRTRSVMTTAGSRPGRSSYQSPCGLTNVVSPSPGPPKQLFQLRVFVVAVDPEAAVAVGDEEVAVGQEADVGRHEGVALAVDLVVDVFAGGVFAGLHRCVPPPDFFAGERELGRTSWGGSW